MKYVKFIVTAWKDGFIGSQVPMTGIDLTMEFARQQLEKGRVVAITPFTQEEWASSDRV